MRVFFKKMGLENIRFKPAYNPYTEVCLFPFSPLPFLPLLSILSISLLFSNNHPTTAHHLLLAPRIPFRPLLLIFLFTDFHN